MKINKAVVLLSADGEIVFTNKAFLNCLQGQANEVIGRKFVHYVYDEDLGLFDKHFRHALVVEHETFNIRLKCTDEQEIERLVNISLYRRNLGSDQLIGLILRSTQ